MSSTLPSYLRRRIGLQIVAILAMLTALMQLLELLDVTTDVFDRGLGFGGLLHYALLRAPAELLLALPLAALLGTMTALHAMARGLEITAMRSAGVGVGRILVWLWPVLLLLVFGQLALSQGVLPQAENELKAWWSASAPPDKARPRLWARTRGGPVSIDAISADGRELRGIRIYERDAAGLLTGRLAAATARWDGATWRLQGASELRIEAGRVRLDRAEAREWLTNLRPDEVLRLDVARPHLSSMMLADVIAGARVGTQPLAYYRTVLYRSFTAPLSLVIMVLIALPTACALTRSRPGGREMALALLLGLAFLVLDGLVAAFGSSGRLPPLASALAAPLLFLAIGLLRLRACERA